MYQITISVPQWQSLSPFSWWKLFDALHSAQIWLSPTLPEKPILCSNISVRSFIAAIVGNLEAVIGERSPVPGKNKQTNRRQWLTEERGQRRTLIRNSSITLEMVRKRTCSRCDRASRKSTVPSVEQNVSTEQGDARGRGVHWGSISNFREVCSNHHDWTSLLEGKRGGAENNLWEE